MATLTLAKLKNILATGLKLREPRFALRKSDSRFYGSVISETFARKGDVDRQVMIQAVLEKAIGPTFRRKVGYLLAYTPYEWDIDEEERPVSRRAKAG
jgi:acid stress-induced BolA-like protein IbaG/YrbA